MPPRRCTWASEYTSCPPQVAEEILVCLQERTRAIPRHEDARLCAPGVQAESSHAGVGREQIPSRQRSRRRRRVGPLSANCVTRTTSRPPTCIGWSRHRLRSSFRLVQSHLRARGGTSSRPPPTSPARLDASPRRLPGTSCTTGRSERSAPAPTALSMPTTLDAWVQDARAGLAEADLVRTGRSADRGGAYSRAARPRRQ